MKRFRKGPLLLLSALACASVLSMASCFPGARSNRPRVIVLGIDGGTWKVAKPMMDAGQLPNLKKLYDGGLHGILESRPPILSPVVWTTIFTGFGYTKHGVKDWSTSQSVNRRVNAIWEILRDQKRKVDVFNVPATWPPDPIPGVMLSGFPLSGATYGGNTGELLTREQIESGTVLALYRESLPAIRAAAAKLAVGKWSPWLDAAVASRPTFRGVVRLYRLSDTDFYATPIYRTDSELRISEPEGLRDISLRFVQVLDVSAELGAIAGRKRQRVNRRLSAFGHVTNGRTGQGLCGDLGGWGGP